jgi:hypothetical protein
MMMGKHAKPGKHTETGQRAGRHTKDGAQEAGRETGKHAEGKQLNTSTTERVIRERAQINEDIQRRIRDGK